jgi:hypothetical protein
LLGELEPREEEEAVCLEESAFLKLLVLVDLRDLVKTDLVAEPAAVDGNELLDGIWGVPDEGELAVRGQLAVTVWSSLPRAR